MQFTAVHGTDKVCLVLKKKNPVFTFYHPPRNSSPKLLQKRKSTTKFFTQNVLWTLLSFKLQKTFAPLRHIISKASPPPPFRNCVWFVIIVILKYFFILFLSTSPSSHHRDHSSLGSLNVWEHNHFTGVLHYRSPDASSDVDKSGR